MGVIELHEGRLYKIKFVRQSGNGRWYHVEAQAVFIGETKRHLSFDGVRNLNWSLRPKMGSMSIPATHLIDAKFIRKVWAREATERDIMLPKQLKGAVLPPTEKSVHRIRVAGAN